MQLSNEPAEELAQFLIDESNGAFSLCGFVCGGEFQGVSDFWSVILIGTVVAR